MKVIDVINKINNGEILTNTILNCNGFLYYVIVIDKKLYFINTYNEGLQEVSNKYIFECFKNNYDFEIINPVEETPKEELEEDKKIEPLNVGIFEETPFFASNGEIMAIKINEIIDYINKENK